MNDIALDAWHFPPAPSRSLRGVAVALVLVAAAGFVLWDRQGPADDRAAAAIRPAPVARWMDIIKPVEIYSLSAPALADAPLVYKARRLTFGAGREDTLAYGKLGGERPSLRIRLYRGDGAGLDSALAFATTTHGTHPLVVHASAASALATRFGRFDTSELELGDVPAKTAACTAFRFGADTPGVSITGVACGARGKPMPRDDLACLINRLDLSSAGEDRALADFFAASELRRNATCAGMRLRPDGLHAAWLDDKPATGVKNLRRR